MYFKLSMRTNPKTDRYSGYYRLVESHRNYDDRVCHRTILNAGYLDELNTGQLNLIQKILTAKVDNHDKPLFELPYTGDATGNMADSKTLEGMINKLRIKTPSSARKALVVIDAGIATDGNLTMIKEKGYDYLCVSRSSLKNYNIEAGATTVTVIKQEDKVYERIGRVKQKYPSIQRYFDIGIEVKDNVEIKRKKKGTEATQEKKKIVTSIKWAIKEGVDINARSGVYFLRTSLEANSEDVLWQLYNTIREIEATFYGKEKIMQSGIKQYAHNQFIRPFTLQYRFA